MRWNRTTLAPFPTQNHPRDRKGKHIAHALNLPTYSLLAPSTLLNTQSAPSYYQLSSLLPTLITVSCPVNTLADIALSQSLDLSRFRFGYRFGLVRLTPFRPSSPLGYPYRLSALAAFLAGTRFVRLSRLRGTTPGSGRRLFNCQGSGDRLRYLAC